MCHCAFPTHLFRMEAFGHFLNDQSNVIGHFIKSGCDWEIYGFFFHSHTSCEPVRHVGLLPAPLLHLKHPLPSYLRLPLGVSVRFNKPYLKPAACPSWSQQSGRMFNELRCEGKRANIIYFIVPPCSNSFRLLFYPLFTFAKSNPTCHSLSSSTFMSPLTLSQRSVSSSLLPYH